MVFGEIYCVLSRERERDGAKLIKTHNKLPWIVGTENQGRNRIEQKAAEFGRSSDPS